MPYVYLVTGIVWAALSLYWAIRFREYRKFLAGAFFVSWGVQLYFYFMKVSGGLRGGGLRLGADVGNPPTASTLGKRFPTVGIAAQSRTLSPATSGRQEDEMGHSGFDPTAREQRHGMLDGWWAQEGAEAAAGLGDSVLAGLRATA
jgi:hypothetical protein